MRHCGHGAHNGLTPPANPLTDEHECSSAVGRHFHDARLGHVCHGSRLHMSKLRLQICHCAQWSDAPIGAPSHGPNASPHGPSRPLEMTVARVVPSHLLTVLLP